MLTEADDLFHPPRPQEATWTETNYFALHQPELNRLMYVYFAAKTNLGVAAYQFFAFRGFPERRADFEHWDMQMYAPLPHTNLDDITLNGALRLRVLEPLTRYHLDYDSGTGTVLDVELDAVCPADDLTLIRSDEGFNETFMNPYAGLPDSGHLEQTLMARGTVTLNGETTQINSYCSRDHSWGARSDRLDRPWPYTAWDTGHFDGGFGFRIMGRITDPETIQCFAGCIYEGGHSFSLVAGRGRVERKGLMPHRIVYELGDNRGNQYVFSGEVVALCDNVNPNMNVMCPCGLVRWECDGQTGWGDVQNAMHLGGVTRPNEFFK